MRLNPLALVFWAITFLAAYLISDSVKIGLWFLLGAFCLSLAMSFLNK